MTDKEKIRALIERRRIAWLHGVSVEAKYKCEECKDILEFIDTLKVKEVQEKPVSIWHDANQQPEINTPILVRTYDNIVVSTKRYDDNLIPWEDRIKRDEITHWCYVEDLLKL